MMKRLAPAALLLAAGLAACAAPPTGTAPVVPLGTDAPAAAASTAPAAPPTLALSGKAAPTAFFQDLDGGAHDVKAYAGKRVVLTFFAHWCPHCQAAMPKIQPLATAAAATTTWVPIEVGGGTAAEVKAFRTTYGITAETFRDPAGQVAQAYGIASYPTHYVLNADGTLGTGVVGDISAPALAPFFFP